MSPNEVNRCAALFADLGLVACAVLVSGTASAGSSYVLPEPPALTVLGERGSSFDEPSAPADFSVSAGQLLGDDGRLRPGGALELSPRALGLTRHITYDRYQRSAAVRALSRTYLSLATASRLEADGAESVLGGLGLRTVLWGGADPLLDTGYLQAATKAREACQSMLSSADPEVVAGYAACIEGAYSGAASTLVAPPWNAPGVVLSTAASFGFSEGRLSRGGSERLSAGLSGAAPLGPSAQGGVSVGWLHHRTAAPDRFDTAAMLRFGAKRTRVKVEGGARVPTDPSAGVIYPVLLGGELQVDEDAWLAVDFGLRLNPARDTVGMLSGLRFQWGQGSTPSFAPELP